LVATASRETLAHTLASDVVDRDAQWEDVFESIRAIRAFCDAMGADFLLVLYPWGHQVADDEWAVGRELFVPEDAEISDRSLDRLLDFAANDGIRVLNTFPAFRAYDGDAPLYYERDMHWTPTGQRLLADELERHLTASGLPRR
jgi:sugar phosphate isomerase/epimerase